MNPLGYRVEVETVLVSVDTAEAVSLRLEWCSSVIRNAFENGVRTWSKTVHPVQKVAGRPGISCIVRRAERLQFVDQV